MLLGVDSRSDDSDSSSDSVSTLSLTPILKRPRVEHTSDIVRPKPCSRHHLASAVIESLLRQRRGVHRCKRARVTWGSGCHDNGAVRKQFYRSSLKQKNMKDIYKLLKDIAIDWNKTPEPEVLGLDELDTKSDIPERQNYSGDYLGELVALRNVRSEPSLTEVGFAKRTKARRQLRRFLKRRVRGLNQRTPSFSSQVREFSIPRFYTKDDFYQEESNDTLHSMSQDDSLNGSPTALEMTPSILSLLHETQWNTAPAPLVMHSEDQDSDDVGQIPTVGTALGFHCLPPKSSTEVTTNREDHVIAPGHEPALHFKPARAHLQGSSVDAGPVYSFDVRNVSTKMEPEQTASSVFSKDLAERFKAGADKDDMLKAEQQPETGKVHEGSAMSILCTGPEVKMNYQGTEDRFDLDPNHSIARKVYPCFGSAGSEWLKWDEKLVIDCKYCPKSQDESMLSETLYETKVQRKVLAEAKLITTDGQSILMIVESKVTIIRKFNDRTGVHGSRIELPKLQRAFDLTAPAGDCCFSQQAKMLMSGNEHIRQASGVIGKLIEQQDKDMLLVIDSPDSEKTQSISGSGFAEDNLGVITAKEISQRTSESEICSKFKTEIPVFSHSEGKIALSKRDVRVDEQLRLEDTESPASDSDSSELVMPTQQDLTLKWVKKQLFRRNEDYMSAQCFDKGLENGIKKYCSDLSEGPVLSPAFQGPVTETSVSDHYSSLRLDNPSILSKLNGNQGWNGVIEKDGQKVVYRQSGRKKSCRTDDTFADIGSSIFDVEEQESISFSTTSVGAADPID